MHEEAPSLTIGRLADRAGVNVETIRYYQRRGLLAEPPRPPSGPRRYGEGEVARVRFIKSAQTLGFTLEEIGELLRLDAGTHCEEARRLAEGKLVEIRHRLAQLRRMEQVLSELVGYCRERAGEVACPLIRSIRER